MGQEEGIENASRSKANAVLLTIHHETVEEGQHDLFIPFQQRWPVFLGVYTIGLRFSREEQEATHTANRHTWEPIA